MEQDKVDFQLPKNRWAAEMACEEANKSGDPLPCQLGYQSEHVLYGRGAIYALALRILRTEMKPVDPDLVRAREIAFDHYKSRNFDTANNFVNGDYDNAATIQCILAALKERGQ